MRAPNLTVIIPITPQEDAWRALLRQIPESWPVVIAASSRPPEVLPDRVHWNHGKPGRGCQLNAGAALADSHWLWFLHADSELQPGAPKAVAEWTSSRDRGLGYLDLQFLNDGPALTRLNAAGANLRSRLFGLPYGDQALCVSNREFQALGGFREDLHRGEDLDFVVRARRAGLAASRIAAGICTSARRYRDQGWLKTTCSHQINAWRLIRQARSRA